MLIAFNEASLLLRIDITNGPIAIRIISANTAIGKLSCIARESSATSLLSESISTPRNLSILIIIQENKLITKKGQENRLVVSSFFLKNRRHPNTALSY